jgi:succinate-semialdehyde dehydrogenase/glutarate-semialdehyde dehydrogenase
MGEFFGPIVILKHFNYIDTAIEEGNRLPYGLAAYAFTGSATTARTVAARIESGMVSINHIGLGLPEAPFGGMKESGYGSEGGAEAIEAYLQTRFITTAGLN